MYTERGNIQLKDPVIPKQIKIMFVGDSGVGKTSIINTFINEVDYSTYKDEPTNGVDIFFKKIKIKEASLLLNLNIWDFSGKISQPGIRQEFYSELHAIVYTFDLSNSVSFSNLENWVKECKKFGGERLIPVLVGTKSDTKREVSSGSVDSFRDKYKMSYFEVSCKDLSSVKKFFAEFANNVYELKPKEKNR